MNQEKYSYLKGIQAKHKATKVLAVIYKVILSISEFFYSFIFSFLFLIYLIDLKINIAYWKDTQ